MSVEERVYKILLVGTESSGKTALITRYTEKKFAGVFQTVLGFYSKSKEVEHDGEKLKIEFVRFNSSDDLSEDNCKNVDALMMVYDITTPNTSEEIINCRNQFFKLSTGCYPNNFPVVVVGNKFDDEKDEVLENLRLDAFLEEHKYFHFKVSAKSNLNVDVMFDNIIKQMKDYETNHLEDKLPVSGLNRSDGGFCIIF